MNGNSICLDMQYPNTSEHNHFILLHTATGGDLWNVQWKLLWLIIVCCHFSPVFLYATSRCTCSYWSIDRRMSHYVKIFFFLFFAQPSVLSMGLIPGRPQDQPLCFPPTPQMHPEPLLWKNTWHFLCTSVRDQHIWQSVLILCVLNKCTSEFLYSWADGVQGCLRRLLSRPTVGNTPCLAAFDVLFSCCCGDRLGGDWCDQHC